MLKIEKQVMVFESIAVNRIDDRQVFDHSVTVIEQDVVMFHGEPIAHSIPMMSMEVASYIEVD